MKKLVKNVCFFSDINECLERGGDKGHQCNMNTNCVNVYGSYECECLAGYTRSDKFNCVEINECTNNQNTCDKNAMCSNTPPGSYTCTCNEGYSGDGRSCVPICNPKCINGECVSKNKCLCRSGYEGTSCEKDLNECKTNNHGCTNTSVCINMLGW